jgi:hypothetical protein
MRLIFHLFTLAFDESSQEGLEINEINAHMRSCGQLRSEDPDYVWLAPTIFDPKKADAESIQVLGIYCASHPEHSEQTIMYIYGLSDLALCAGSTLPISFNHYEFGYAPKSKEERLAAACYFSPNDEILDLYFATLGFDYTEYKTHFTTAWENRGLSAEDLDCFQNCRSKVG